MNGLRIEMTNLQGFIVWGLKIRKTQELKKINELDPNSNNGYLKLHRHINTSAKS